MQKTTIHTTLWRALTLTSLTLLAVMTVSAQERRVENRPYTDLRPFHLGIVVGTHLQDMELENVGMQDLLLSDGTTRSSLVTADQHNWESGFNVGVIGELRLNEFFAFRVAPQMYFSTRNIAFQNYSSLTPDGYPTTENQSMKTVYVGVDLDIIYASKRFNNHRPYLMAGLAPMMNLTSNSGDYVQLKKSDVFFEIGMGCDFYLPFFKLRPELKFMLGLKDCLDTSRQSSTQDDIALPYIASVRKAQSKMIVLSFYFE